VNSGRDLADETARRLFERRTVMLTGPLDGEAATVVGASLMALDAEGDDPVTLLVNSPGGPVEAGVAVVDVLDLLGVPVEATCIGQAVGTAAVVVACATPGRRRAAPNARLSCAWPRARWRGRPAASSGRRPTCWPCATGSSTGSWPPPANPATRWRKRPTAAPSSPPRRRWPPASSTRSPPGADRSLAAHPHDV
jgi:hypothetical protein